jgi:hypothetical protein
MKSIFGMFERYEDARATIDTLLDQGFEQDAVNVIVLEEIADDLMQVNQSQIDVKVTDEVGEKTAQGLDPLLGVQHPIDIPRVGQVYAAGELATVLAKTAAAPGAVDDGLEAALVDFGVSEATAQAYSAGVKQGGVLLWIRSDEAHASTAVETLRSQHGMWVTDYG